MHSLTLCGTEFKGGFLIPTMNIFSPLSSDYFSFISVATYTADESQKHLRLEYILCGYFTDDILTNYIMLRFSFTFTAHSYKQPRVVALLVSLLLFYLCDFQQLKNHQSPQI